MKDIFNFGSGPSMLPKIVLKKIKRDLFNWKNTNVSVMEISHRNKNFLKVIENIKNDIKFLLSVSNDYNIILLQGGARAQFSGIPMNLTNNFSDLADYINTGYWGMYAAIEAKKYCSVNIIDVIEKKDKLSILPMKNWNISKNSVYLHYCPNETINGTAIYETPKFKNKIVVADFSSTILSRPIDVNKFDIIYASSQKNIGVSGMTIMIFKKNIFLKQNKFTPSILNYEIIYKNNSLFNTPPTFNWYVSGLVLKWLIDQGGVKKINNINKIKSKLIYDIIDKSKFYKNNIYDEYRSYMNIIFYLPNKKLNNLFLKLSKINGLLFLKGHRAVGGIRASMYNSMTIKGAKKLANFMKYFEKRYG
ncbi:serC [Wigglesworthia glossinidia endosymbiont of Glossina brevipalpis]|uniref:Phosphoserine aminotransferase n=1 Tax=Wigglesworthia glossinidia brevipalpis TaxID=36870 RepID=SERC_WIGBR|nr:RecName: Full=Phosphoserine aminotransferase; AltName: Full=Phosphohydroxythreonine aminotransferase; Short=PSAT [Wigglesworthia glossinidia endosymbiont of Glossina brevipalpis]BAC24632.1 serC [Wigglesworthia glossinidia endosymbiont of Glossina brevipalpis]